MGKSWKEKPDKWRKNRDFQKKQQKKNGNKPQYQPHNPSGWDDIADEFSSIPPYEPSSHYADGM